MTQEPTGEVLVIQPSDASLKITDIVEKIISGILETGEITVIGINDSIFLTCSAINMATEIAKVYINDICLANLEFPDLGKTYAISTYLSQNQIWDYSKFAEQEEKELKDVSEQTISVSRGTTLERLVTISLLKLAKFDKIRVVAAGSSINDSVVLALKLANGQISKDAIGIKLVHLNSILMRNDPTKSIAAISIYIQKGISTRNLKRQNALLKKIETGKP
jgi:hypothetical protein